MVEAVNVFEKKLQEAQSFLDKMRDQERKAFGDKEAFDHYLSAFPSAGTERPVTEVCAEYLALLARMVTQYKTDAPH